MIICSRQTYIAFNTILRIWDHEPLLQSKRRLASGSFELLARLLSPRLVQTAFLLRKSWSRQVLPTGPLRAHDAIEIWHAQISLLFFVDNIQARIKYVPVLNSTSFSFNVKKVASVAIYVIVSDLMFSTQWIFLQVGVCRWSIRPQMIWDPLCHQMGLQPLSDVGQTGIRFNDKRNSKMWVALISQFPNLLKSGSLAFEHLSIACERCAKIMGIIVQ